jgi:hypothetical protein
MQMAVHARQGVRDLVCVVVLDRALLSERLRDAAHGHAGAADAGPLCMAWL